MFGYAAHAVVPDLVAQDVSRGHESVSGKLFMRLSVVVADVLVMVPAVWAVWRSRAPALPAAHRLAGFAVTLLFPGVILIDHGHFQYNCVSLGLVVWAVYASGCRQWAPAAALFAAALNFKQMSLYFAPAFAVWLLADAGATPSTSRLLVIGRVVAMALAGLWVFAVLWLPFGLTTPASAGGVRAGLYHG